jgi:cyclophilin family peptidyl-prolyl cis-trans isomerase
MRTLLSLVIVLGLAISGSAQTGTSSTPKTSTTGSQTSKSKSSAKPATSTKPAGTATAAPAKPSEPPQVVFDTPLGQISCVLFPDKAPKTVANFIGLANGTKTWTNQMTGQVMKGKSLYEGTIFHRVIPNFMIQGGDPLGNGTGGPGYSFEDEFSPELEFDRPGRLAMANSGPSTNGSQFFITEVPTPHLNNLHTIFGQCDDASVDIVKAIARVPADPRNNRPDQAVTIQKITILGVPKPASTPKSKTVPRKPVQPKQ